MTEFVLKTSRQDNPELENFLTDSVFRYGVEQLGGEAPQKLYCWFNDAQDRIVAGIMGTTTRNVCFVSHLYVASEFRNRGYGTKLLLAFESLARQSGCHLLRLNTLNSQAADFYLRAGYVKSVCIKEYIDGFDLIFFHKKIITQ